jgi:hypothetical protein
MRNVGRRTLSFEFAIVNKHIVIPIKLIVCLQVCEVSSGPLTRMKIAGRGEPNQ